MSSPLKSLVASGTKLWLDSIDPDLVVSNRALGATGATSNPIIIADLLKTGRFDQEIVGLIAKGGDDHAIAWALTDKLVGDAQEKFRSVWDETKGDDGYVSFELDPLLEDLELGPPHAERVAKYIELGKKWSAGHTNRLIKVPATPGGLAALEELTAAGVNLNITLIFSERQYNAARDATWRGMQRLANKDKVKTVYSIFVSRLDVYTEKHCADLIPAAQGQVGIVNAKYIWKLNTAFWAGKGLKLQQEMIFASTGTKKPSDVAWKYVAAFAGADIETNPPGTNKAVQASGQTFTKQIDQLPPKEVLDDIAKKVNMQHLEETLMTEGLAKFADPQKALLKLIGEKRAALK